MLMDGKRLSESVAGDFIDLQAVRQRIDLQAVRRRMKRCRLYFRDCRDTLYIKLWVHRERKGTLNLVA
jgi:hypothetical protein